jgi:hypothetical protein
VDRGVSKESPWSLLAQGKRGNRFEYLLIKERRWRRRVDLQRVIPQNYTRNYHVTIHKIKIQDIEIFLNCKNESLI